ncbi:MAG: uroporphyrinogen-III C-methyltransferase [Rhizobiaceae bacterium]|nr:MAG: uroporphyrinogen-III C-methyltransferase [Rhizobiaceae bacterium]CAG1005520.1 uroporphyrin-III C-methyltransferase / precorrin-2 dehydrogenase / sirohydrochlorin ferrochelatase [Rhizobiaceae bacterium]
MQVVSRQPSEEAPPRIGPLSVLPVFFDLAGKRAVVAGGTGAAAWKADLLATAGAAVDVFACDEALSDEMLRIAEREPKLTIYRRRWDAACLAGVAVALADAGGDEEAAAFQAAARRAGAACNVIDKPAYCDFQFGAIVNRSPVVVGISTSGAAPILGQAVRRRIETLLPASLADWAALARALRQRVVEALATGQARRAFWERFVDRAFGSAPSDTAERELSAILRGMDAEARAGHVTFVGAGPGEAELLTLKAVRALQAADVILFDDLVSDEVLELARREAKRILVGKRAGRPSCKQHEINAMMIALAKAGRRVVRLKSGDPMIFGRAGEEIAALEQENIAYDVVPGITAGIALAARLGVSLTHRDCARSVRFVTGHSRHGGLPQDLDWAAIADPSTTTIFYMGGRTAAQISTTLVDRGMPATTPAVVAADIGRACETMHRTDLAGLRDAAELAGDRKAVLIGIGAVFAREPQSAYGLRTEGRRQGHVA